MQIPEDQPLRDYVKAQQAGLQGWGNKFHHYCLTKLIPTLKDLRVLEIGGSSGEHFDFRLDRERKKFEKPSRYVILDPAAGMTNPHLRDELIRDHSVIFETGVAERMPFSSGSFNCVLSTCVLHHVSSVDTVMSEISRVLEPGGRFVVSIPTDPGFANSSVKALITYPQMRRVGFKDPKAHYEVHHKNSFGEIVKAIRGTKQFVIEKEIWFPFGIRNVHANLLLGILARKKA